MNAKKKTLHMKVDPVVARIAVEIRKRNTKRNATLTEIAQDVMTITYTSSIDWGWESGPTTAQRKSWLARASAFLSDLFPGAEVTVQEHEDRSTVRFGGELPEPLDYSESEVRELLQAEWESFVGTQD